MKKKILKISGLTLLLLITGIFVFAKVNRVTPLAWNSKQINQPMFSDVAINGYDAVAYFSDKKAIKGDESINYTWNDATWLFSNGENKRTFASNPEQYLPEYGGFCAFAVSKGFTANTDPNSFTFINGKLYMFADENVKNDWMNNQPDNLATSDSNWN